GMCVGDGGGSAARSGRELRGFTRIAVAPGETVCVVFALAVRALAFHDVSMRRVVEPGAVTVMVGASSDDIRLRGAFEITGPVHEVGREVAFTTPVRIESQA